MADVPGYLRTCLDMGKIAFLAILVSTGIVLQILVSPKRFFQVLILPVYASPANSRFILVFKPFVANFVPGLCSVQ